jgi:putative hemolysin
MEEKVKNHIVDLVIILSLLIVNGILAMTEIALISSNKNRMGNLAKKSEGARVALQLMDNLGKFLSTIQIGITIIGIISGTFSGQKFAEPLGTWLNNFSLIHGHGNLIAFSFVVLTVTYVSLVIGELIPKRIALSKPEKIAIMFAQTVRLLSKLTYPFVVALDVSTKNILNLLGQKEIKESVVTEEEIHSVIKQGLEEGAIDAFEHKVFQKVLQFGDREASIMMTPRIKLIFLDLEDSIEENKIKISSNPHRYYPVIEGDLDNFKGIVDTKDILTQQMQNHPFDLRALIKEAPCVIEDSLGPDLIDQFVKYKAHIAIVVDEYGAMQGIVTLVDIFETLVGSVPEYHQEKHSDNIIPREDGSWLCEGLTPIDDIEDLLQIKIISEFEENDFNTLAGFLLIHFKHIPKAGELVHWDNFKFEIMDMDRTRIDKVLIQKK